MNQSKTSFVCASLLGILLAGQTNAAWAAVVTVCPSGCDQTTVQGGINAAVSGDTVLVGTPGRVAAEMYEESIEMKDGVSLVSEGLDSLTTYTDPFSQTTENTKQVLTRATLTILHGLGNATVVLFPFGTDAVLDGFTIENIDDTAADLTALIRVGDSSPTIQNNIVRDNQGPGQNGGISMMGVTDVAAPLIQNNVIHYVNGSGIGLRTKSNPTIIDNEIFTTPSVIDSPPDAPGIGIANDSAATILNNHIFSNGAAGIGSAEDGVYDSEYDFVIQGNLIHDHPTSAGIFIMAQVGQATSNVNMTIGGSVPAEGNTIYGNRIGVRLGTAVAGTRQLFGTALVQNNTISNNDRAGLWINHVTYAEVLDNTMEFNNRVGMRAENNEDIIIENNTMQNNSKAGLYLLNSYVVNNTVLVQNNDIINNTGGGITMAASGLNVVIKKNEITGNAFGGIRIGGGTDLEISDNQIAYNIRGGIHTGDDQANGTGLHRLETPGGFTMTIRGNKVHHNGQGIYGGGIDVRHADGTIENNLVYKNNRGGIRFGDWIDAINHNTVVGNGISGIGAGIVYDDLAGDVNDSPAGFPPAAIPIRNNVLVDNSDAGINAGTTVLGGGDCSDWVGLRDYNLVSGNNGTSESEEAAVSVIFDWRRNLATCSANPGEIYVVPEFIEEIADDYHLQATSPAVDAGDPAFPIDVQPPGLGNPTADMGAYGGEYGINW